MRQAVRRLAAVCGSVVLTVTVTACAADEHPSVAPLAQISVEDGPTAASNGIDELTPEQVLERAIAALQATGSYRVSGTTTGGNAINITFKVGVGSVGTVSSGNPVQLVAARGAIYVTGDPASLAAQVGADVDSTIAGKWLLISADSASGFAIFADGTTFATAVLGAEAPAEMTGVADVGGVPAVGLIFPETGGTLWVAARGEPVPLRFEEKGATAEAGVLTFTDFGTEVAVKPPAPDAVVDLTKLADQETP